MSTRIEAGVARWCWLVLALRDGGAERDEARANARVKTQAKTEAIQRPHGGGAPVAGAL